MVQTRKAEPRSEVHRGRRRIDPDRVIGENVASLEGMATVLALVEVDSIPDQAREEWADRLAAALAPLRHFVRELRTTRAVALCARCGGQFVPLRSDAQFCSDRCRVASHRARAAS